MQCSVLISTLTAIMFSLCGCTVVEGGSQVVAGKALEQARPGVRIFDERAFADLVSPEERHWDVDGIRRSFQAETSIHDCQGLLRALVQSRHPNDLWIVGMQERDEYHSCVQEALLRRARVASGSHFAEINPLRDVIKRLNLVSFGSTWQHAFPDRDTLTWLEIVRDERFRSGTYGYEPEEIWLETDDFYHGFVLAALAD